MKKMETWSNCFFCHHEEDSVCRHPGIGNKYEYPNGRIIEEVDPNLDIPSWCPLPDAIDSTPILEAYKEFDMQILTDVTERTTSYINRAKVVDAIKKSVER